MQTRLFMCLFFLLQVYYENIQIDTYKDYKINNYKENYTALHYTDYITY